MSGSKERSDENSGENHWCFAWFAQPQTEARPRAALAKDAKWTPSDTITVSFLDGDPSVQERIKEVARIWTGPSMANLSLAFRNDTNTLIRISFKRSGSWSVLGTTCKRITNRSQPTMNYGWLTPSSTDDELRRVVLHEFGHALGLIHEHQHPQGGIKWNKPAVYRDLEGTWTREQIDFNLFDPYDNTETNFNAFDVQSIMMYPIPSRWTLDGFSAGLNTDLSPHDRDFIRQQYP